MFNCDNSFVGNNIVAKDYMWEIKMAFQRHEYCLYRHTDIGLVYSHLISNRISREDREVWSDHFSRRRNMDAMRKLEKKYGLKQVKVLNKRITDDKLNREAKSMKDEKSMGRGVF